MGIAIGIVCAMAVLMPASKTSQKCDADSFLYSAIRLILAIILITAVSYVAKQLDIF